MLIRHDHNLNTAFVCSTWGICETTCYGGPHRFLRVAILFGVLAACWAAAGQPLCAQQKIGYVDTEYILEQLPEYASVQQKLDKLEQQWRDEIQDKREQVDTLRQEFRAREVLYTDAERKRKREAIRKAEAEVERLRQRYFGPDGRLYSRQKELMRPIQERVLKAVETIATSAGYDYVLDKKGETLFLFARDEHDLSNRVLRELGINVDREEGGR